tara:strand:- start:215 stop:589 length:375 start_codon:yes stop_codon:yes gene_type:complete
MLNEVTLIGNLGADPELRRAKNDLAVTQFSVATRWKEETTWHRIVCFGGLAENMHKMLSRGSLVAVKGRIDVSSYEKDGIKRQSFQIVSNYVQVLSPREKRAPAETPSVQVEPALDEALEDIPF